ncbi:TPA: transposase [Escherichia coli]
MVKLTLQPSASVAHIAREHNTNDNLLFKWL